jgi:D-sedoheptulose 7-phosphate isomerase
MSNKEDVMDPQCVIEDVRKISLEFFKKKQAVFSQALDGMERCLRAGGKILVFGNGGSASQAQHFAAELVNRFLKDRSALAAVALTTDSSALTSIANDTSFDRVFSRQIEALGRKGDVALGLSTSGNSPNMVLALEAAKLLGMKTVGISGRGGGCMAALADFLLDIPSDVTPRIQEVHLLILHLLAEGLENRLSGG